MAVENPRGWRIAKERALKKIDAIVALAMACVVAERGRVVNLGNWMPGGRREEGKIESDFKVFTVGADQYNPNE